MKVDKVEHFYKLMCRKKLLGIIGKYFKLSWGVNHVISCETFYASFFTFYFSLIEILRETFHA